MSEPSNELKGLGGWLGLMGIGVVIAPFRLLSTVLPEYWTIFTDGLWEALTSPESESYHAFWAPLIIGEGVINLGVTIASFYLIYLYFEHKKLFPQLYIAILVFSPVFTFLGAWASTIVLPDEPMFNPDTVGGFGGQLLVALIWIRYMWVSRRVKATFVE